MSNFCVSDLHGCYSQWRQIQSFCKDSDRIFVLGDCIDRGPNSLGTLKSVLNDPRVVLIKGNHEDMFQAVLEEERDFGMCRECWDIWAQNGGITTYDEWQMDGRNFDWIPTLKRLPLQTTYINPEGVKYLMTHSGTVPSWWRQDGTPIASGHDALWDRQHFNKKYEGEWICIGGHTPILLLIPNNSEWLGGAFYHCDNRKINIDNCTYHTGMSCLFDLDTYDEHIFEG